MLITVLDNRMDFRHCDRNKGLSLIVLKLGCDPKSATIACLLLFSPAVQA